MSLRAIFLVAAGVGVSLAAGPSTLVGSSQNTSPAVQPAQQRPAPPQMPNGTQPQLPGVRSRFSHASVRNPSCLESDLDFLTPVEDSSKIEIWPQATAVALTLRKSRSDPRQPQLQPAEKWGLDVPGGYPFARWPACRTRQACQR